MRTADSLSVVRVACLLLAVSVPVVLVNPVGMIFVGAVFGVITAAVLNYLVETKKPQGVMNGMFNMTQYAGMAALPFAAGLLVVRCPCYVR